MNIISSESKSKFTHLSALEFDCECFRAFIAEVLLYDRVSG